MQKNNIEVLLDMFVNAELNVEGMSCDHCTTAVKNSLTALDGVENVRVDLSAKRVTVRYDESKTRLVDIKQTLMGEGYAVMEI